MATYDQAHRLERERWRPAVEAGQAICAEPICLMPDRAIAPGARWDLSHDPTGTQWIGPSHRRCNIAEGNRRRKHVDEPHWIL